MEDIVNNDQKTSTSESLPEMEMMISAALVSEYSTIFFLLIFATQQKEINSIRTLKIKK